MANDSAYIETFKTFARANPTVTDLAAIEQEMYGASDRACAVMLGSVVESCLHTFVRGKLRPALNNGERKNLFDFRGPLGTFAAKTMVAYAFNFFGFETRDDLDLIRTIRNEFAHSRRSFDFRVPEVVEVCRHLKSPDWPGAFIPHGYLNSVPHEKLREATDRNNGKTRYVSACHVLAHRFLDNSAIAGATGMFDLR